MSARKITYWVGDSIPKSNSDTEVYCRDLRTTEIANRVENIVIPAAYGICAAAFAGTFAFLFNRKVVDYTVISGMFAFMGVHHLALDDRRQNFNASRVNWPRVFANCVEFTSAKKNIIIEVGEDPVEFKHVVKRCDIRFRSAITSFPTSHNATEHPLWDTAAVLTNIEYRDNESSH